MSKDEIYTTVKRLLVSKFQVPSDLIGPQKLLDDDLEFDSLDAVDLLHYLDEFTVGKPEPTLFRNAMTVQDLVDMLLPVWKKS